MPGESYGLTPRAESDLDNIFDYTFENWGEEQAVKYIKQLFKRFVLIAKIQSQVKNGTILEKVIGVILKVRTICFTG